MRNADAVYCCLTLTGVHESRMQVAANDATTAANVLKEPAWSSHVNVHQVNIFDGN